MTILDAKALLENMLTMHAVNGSLLTPDGEALKTAIKFIEENYFEWVPIKGDAECQALPPEGEIVMLCYKSPILPEHLYYAEAYVLWFDDEFEWMSADIDLQFNQITPIAWKRRPKLVKYEPSEPANADTPQTSGMLAADLTQNNTITFTTNPKR